MFAEQRRRAGSRRLPPAAALGFVVLVAALVVDALAHTVTALWSLAEPAHLLTLGGMVFTILAVFGDGALRRRRKNKETAHATR